MKNTIIDYASYALFLFLIIGWAIVLFFGLREMDKGRSQRAEEALEQKATMDKQKAQDASQRASDTLDRASGIQRVYWDKQENGFRDVPRQAAY